jgi:hypothetical protein
MASREATMRLSTIRNLYSGGGPWASVYLDATGTQVTGTPLEAHRGLDLRWRAARESLRRAGADEPTLRAIDAAVRETPTGGGRAEVAVLASQGRVAFSHALPVPPGREAATWSDQPRAADLVRAFGSSAKAGAGEDIRWVCADVDRTGGTVTANDGTTATVRGEDEFITKVSTGGRARRWSMPRIQRAAEVNWGRNSSDLARALIAAADRTGADVVVLAGDVRARQLVHDRLPRAIAERVVEVDHETAVRPHPDSAVRARREPDVYDSVLVDATREAVASVARERIAEAADRFHSGLSHGRSVRGLGPVCTAAREQRIDTLVLSAEPSHRVAWVDPRNPTMVGESKRDTGTELAISEPADDAVVGAAAIAGAQSIVIEADPELVDGLGAILRYPDENAPPYFHPGDHERPAGGP